ncbi:MAG: hypothetical protein AB7T63_13620 [Planctomycetota bacterium]
MARPYATRWLSSALALLLLVASGAHADDKAPPAADDPLGPIERVFVPVDQLDLLLQSQREGIVLDHAAYRRLLEAARAKARAGEAPAPVDGTWVDATATVNLLGARHGTIEGTWTAVALRPGTSRLPFPLQGAVLESLEGEGARLEQAFGRAAVVWDQPGRHTVSLRLSAPIGSRDGSRTFVVDVPAAAAMSFDVQLPPGVEGVIEGMAGAQRFTTPAGAPTSVRARPTAQGRLAVTFAAAAKVAEGPPILDAHVVAAHRLGDGRDELRIAAEVDVYRTATDRITLDVPEDLALLAVGGDGVVRHARSEDRRQLVLELAAPKTGRLVVTLQGEVPFAAEGLRELPAVHVVDALRERATVGVDVASDVRVDDVLVQDGRRLPADKGQTALRFGLVSAAGTLRLAVRPTATVLEAVSTHYLNLTETGRSLLVTITYRALEGTVHRLAPRVPVGFEVRRLEVNGRTDGFVRDTRADGTLDITLAEGLREGQELTLSALLERDAADWLPDDTTVELPFKVPSAGADREEGLVGIGADAAFEVRERGRTDLVAVGAADLTERGVRAEGLVFGYRIDGAAPAVTYEVERRTPVVEAEVVTTLSPSPRRLDVQAIVVHDVRRAGVRTFRVDVPSWAGDEVRFQGSSVRGHEKLPINGTRPGYDRYEVTLGQRVVGRHSLVVLYHRDTDGENWSVEADVPLLPDVPLERVERYVVVQRAEGLEVRLPGASIEGDARTVEASDLPIEAPASPLATLEVLHLVERRDGLALGVQRHDGAAVLDAIGVEARLWTAVAREGVLRTRALVVLKNAGRQQVPVELPPGSHLIGALVGPRPGALEPVKPLRSRQGVLLVPLNAAGGGVACIALTYETRADRPFDGEVTIPAPTFPGLEVLLTSHEVAFDEDIDVRSMQGDFGVYEAPAKRSSPWIASLLRGRTWGADSKAPSIRNYSPFESPVDFGGLPPRVVTTKPADDGVGVGKGAPPPEPPLPEEVDGVIGFETFSDDETFGQSDAPFQGPAATPAPRPGSGPDRSGTRESNDPMSPPPPPSSEPPVTADSGVAARPPGGAQPAADPDFPAGPGEGGFRRGDGGRAGAAATGPRRRGLLSLDVPVVLGPRRVRGERLGQGGALVIRYASPTAHVRSERLAFGLVTALGALLAWGSRRRRWTVVIGLLAAALVVHLVLGPSASAWASAAVDAATLLVGVFAVRALLGWLRGRAAAKAAPVAAAVLLAAMALGATAAPARADEPEADTSVAPEDVVEPRRVYVPYDPDAKELPEDPSRVFLPLSTWRHLFRIAHPGEDPELVRTGQRLAAEGVAWRLVVHEDAVVGTLRIDVVKDGEAPSALQLGLGGAALEQARLDGTEVRVALIEGAYRVEIDEPGRHVLEMDVRLPLVSLPDGERQFSFRGVPFPNATLDLSLVDDFRGEVLVDGIARVDPGTSTAPGVSYRVWLGRTSRVRVRLVPPRGETLPADVRARATTRTVHSLRDGGTETDVALRLEILEGAAPFADLTLPPGCRVLEASGAAVTRWETLERQGEGRVVRLVFDQPRRGRVDATVRIVCPASADERDEVLPAPRILDVTSESGEVVVNAPPHRKAEILEEQGLYRIERPRDPRACGFDNSGVVVRAWRFSQRPTRLAVRLRAAERRVDLRETTRVVVGDDAVRTWMDVQVSVVGAPTGDLVFGLPGEDDVRHVGGPHVRHWWLAGAGADRKLFVRLGDLHAGDLGLGLVLETRLAGRLDAIAVPRLLLPGVREESGRLLLYARPDVEPVVGSLPGLKAVALGQVDAAAAPVPGARLTHAFVRERALSTSLPLVLRRPEASAEATVVTLVAPGEREHRLEQLVLVEVLRGAVDAVQVFVPDGGAAGTEEVRARDLREVRRRAVSRAGADGRDVDGTLYDVVFQSPRTGLVAVTFSSNQAAGRPVRPVRPEGTAAVRWFSMVRTWTDGQVTAGVVAGHADEAAWADLPFVPASMPREAVLEAWVGRAPYALSVATTRHRLGAQAEAVVLAAHADVVVGRDGEARARVTYRVFNRSRQFLTVRLPEGARLFGASSAGVPVKPLTGPAGSLLLPVPKVPLGGRGYPVTVLYGVRVGGTLRDGGRGTVSLPVIDGVEIERTAVRLRLPEELEASLDTRMDVVEDAEISATLASADAEEARRLLEVAETGTLAQREQALANGQVLLRQAKNRAYQAAKTKARALDEELGRLTSEWSRRNERLQRDRQAAQRSQQVVASQVEFGGNAARIVDIAPGPLGGETAPDAASAFWCFNGMPGDTTVAEQPAQTEMSKDIAQLKKRLESTLSDEKKAEEVRRAFAAQQSAAQQEGMGRAGAEQQELYRFGQPGQQRQGQVAWLNDNLRMDQERSQQLGAARNASERGTIYRIDAGATTIGFGGGGGGAFGDAEADGSLRGQPTTSRDVLITGTDYDAGSHYSTGGGSGGAGGEFNDLTGDGRSVEGWLLFSGDGDNSEVPLFGSEPDVGATAGMPAGTPAGEAWGRVLIPAQQRAGLMGVDVPLPREGREHLFTSLKGGAPITFTLSRSGFGFGARLALLVALLGGLVAAGVWWVRRA